MLKIVQLFCVVILLGSSSSIFALTAQQIYQKVSQSVFTVYSLDHVARKVKARGSAVAVTKHILATNCHVALAGNYNVVKLNAKSGRVARLFYKNSDQDLCLLDVPQANFTPVKLRKSEQVKIGEVVYAIGNPRGTEKTLSKGIISNRHPVKNGYWLQTDARIYYGSSGGGLFDEDAQLVGITTKMGGNFGFAIPSEWIENILKPNKSIPLKKSMSSQPTPNVDKNSIKSIIGSQNTSEPAQQKVLQQNKSINTGSLKKIGSFGGGNIDLYRNKKTCFFLVAGRNNGNQVVARALWNPNFPKSLMFFPLTAAPQKILTDIYQISRDKRNQVQQSRYRASSTIVINGRVFPLLGLKTANSNYGYIQASFSDNPMYKLETIGSLQVKVSNKDFTTVPNAAITFNMKGFSRAFEKYTQACT